MKLVMLPARAHHSVARVNMLMVIWRRL
jgi:hypothetical protein